MQVNDTVKVKAAAEEDQESVGRAGRIVKMDPNDDDRDDQWCHVELDETPTHHAGEALYLESQLEFLGR